MHIIEFCSEVEKIIANQVKGNYPVDWDEDFITRSILREFRNSFSYVEVDGLKNTITMAWSAYKLPRPPETKFGDVAILINIRYQDGDDIEGVGFLEAKKRDKDKITFSALKIPQLKRINKNAPHSMLLLYDYEDITKFANEIIPNKDFYWFYYAWTPYTYSVVVPSDIFLLTKQKNTTLYKYSLPFSYQLCFRYFSGLDLEFQEKAIEIAKGYNEKMGANYLLVISIAHGRMESPIVEFNRNRFTEL